MKRVQIVDVVGTPNWIAPEAGLKVYETIVNDIRAGIGVELSFRGRVFVTTGFLNSAIGKFYNGDFTDDQLGRLLVCVDTDEEDREKLTRVIARAKEYFKAPEIHDAVLRQEPR